MSTNAELKKRGRFAFRNNYWPAVLVAFILVLLTTSTSSTTSTNTNSLKVGGGDKVSFGIRIPVVIAQVINLTSSTEDNVMEEYANEYRHDSADGVTISVGDTVASSVSNVQIGPIVVTSEIAGLSLLLCILALVFVLFVEGPIKVGASRFFLCNLRETPPAEVMGSIYRDNWTNVGIAMWVTGLIEAFFTLLLIVPGIIKYYQYLLVPYILAEHPDWTGSDARAESKRMMQGNKMDAFLLQLSFIGWELLSALTAGILGVFYVTPYYNSTMAALYDELKWEDMNRRSGNYTSGPIISEINCE